MMKYLYYPGCSLKSTGRAYEESLLAVFGALGVQLEEIDDWNCCGATAYMAVDELKAFSLAARNLALAEKQVGAGNTAEVVAPCAACFLVQYKAQKYMKEYPQVEKEVRVALQSIGLHYDGKVNIRHPIEVLLRDIGVERIKEHVKRPLKGLKIACYYGCQLVRPYPVFDDPHNPKTKELLMQTLGAETVDWPLKTRCCGGSLTGTMGEIGLPLSHAILREAHRRGADVIATSCPLCQFNLECYQDQKTPGIEKTRIPVAFFTQLMGLAMGLSEKELGLQRLFVPVAPVLKSGERA
ncbi:MAG TPA: CoB--CoM heterodisulfide reductase iron-sulfur subunit B family protein [bacterium]|nr:CoB--CoM heterodisulfide reductase iron-sulfur subunit B family protein [bacterium]